MFSVVVDNISTWQYHNLPYIVSTNNVVGGGYLYLDLGPNGSFKFVNQVTDGLWVPMTFYVHKETIGTLKYRYTVFVNAISAGYYAGYSYDTSNGTVETGTLFDDGVFSLLPFEGLLIKETLHSNLYWALDDSNSMYNINAGNVGIGVKANEVDSNAMLHVGGNIVVKEDIRFKDHGKDEIILSSRTDLGHILRLFDSSNGKTRILIDTDGQLGINTSIPQNRLHVVGDFQVTERTSIGAGDSPLGKLHVKGEGTTYQTLAIYAQNHDGMDLFRVHDDGSVWAHHLIGVDPGDLNLQELTFGNGLTATPDTPYDGTVAIDVEVGDLLASPTGVIYTG
jgi:hypothetical protein